MNQDRTLQEAARRHARLQAHDCPESEQSELGDWEKQSVENAAASDLAQHVLTSMDELSANEEFSRKLIAMTDEALNAYPAQHDQPQSKMEKPRPWRWVASLAAGVAVAAVAVQMNSHQSTREIQSSAFETAEHERRSVTLEDGSTVELDVGTRIAVRMSPGRREIDLLSGRALFEVAHDASRPFSVTAEDSRTTALGTKFQVEKASDHVVVTLAEGSVAVDGGEQRATAASWQERLRPGEQLSISGTTAQRTLQAVDPQLVTSWTHGRHVFRGTPLHEALDEVNRYATKKVRLGDPSLADLQVAGNFVAGDSEVVVDAFAAVLPLRVVEGGEHEIILFRRYGE
ncbi:MAG: FecR family protein [Povalibacter sp.]